VPGRPRRALGEVEGQGCRHAPRGAHGVLWAREGEDRQEGWGPDRGDGGASLLETLSPGGGGCPTAAAGSAEPPRGVPGTIRRREWAAPDQGQRRGGVEGGPASRSAGARALLATAPCLSQ